MAKSLHVRPGFWKIILGVSLIALVAMTSTLGLLYRAACRERLRELARETETLSLLADSFVRLDVHLSADPQNRQTRASHVRDLEKSLAGFIGWQSGKELVIGRTNGVYLEVLRATPDKGFEVAAKLEFDGMRGRPLFEGLAGRRGSGKFTDYRGVPVLAAYAPVPALRIGVVYKVDLARVRAPFVRAAAGATGVYAILVALFSLVHWSMEGRWEQRLDLNERRLRSILESSSDRIFLIDPEGTILVHNPASAAAYGDDLNGRNVFALVPADVAEARKVRCEQAARSGHPLRYEDKFGARYADVVITPVYDGAGTLASFVVISRDITERKLAELALAESEARYRRAERGTNDGLWEWNVATGEEYFSPRWLEILGYSRGDLPNTLRALSGLIHPEDRKVVRAAIKRHLRDARPFDVEMRLRCKSGSYLWVRSRGEAERDANGKALRMAGAITDISREKDAATVLQHERDRLRQILDSQFAFVAVLSLGAEIVEVNQTPLRLLGVSRADVLGRRFWDIGWLETEDTVPQVQAMFAAAARGEPGRGDVLARFPGVGLRHVDAGFSPLRNAAGEVVNVICFGVDITQRKQAEAQLRAERNFSNAVLDSAGALIVVLDREGRFRRFNRAAERLSGYSFAEVEGRLVWDTVLPPEAAHTIRKEAFEAIVSNPAASASTYTNEWVSRSGERRLLDWNNGLMLDSAGRVEFMVSVGIDITDRKRAEEALLHSESYLRTIIESEPECVKLVARDCTLLDMNPAGLRMIGAGSLDEVRGRNVLDIVEQGYREAFRDGVVAVFRGETTNQIFEIVSLDGVRRWLEQHAVPMRDPAHPAQVKHMLAVTRDISQRKRAELLLRESEKFAATGRMAARIAHEINNPLGGIRNAFSLIKDSIPASSGNARWVGMIDREIDRIAGIVRQMFEMYQSQPQKPKEVIFDRIVSEVADLMSGAAAHRQVKIVLPSLAAPIRGRQVPGFVSQILYNLLSNALDVSPVRGTVAVRIECVEDWVVIEVEDQGDGIPANVQGRIFEPFFSTKTGVAGSGMGLGLPVARGLAESMGGTLDFTTRAGRGTTFRLRIPRIVPESGAE